jgi:hypothetical protein
MKLPVAFSGGSAKLEPLPIHHCRRSVQRFEIRDQVSAVSVVLQASVDHRRVGTIARGLVRYLSRVAASQVTPSFLWSAVYWKPGTPPAGHILLWHRADSRE